MKCYPPSKDYIEDQRKYNWLHSNGSRVNQDDLDNAQKVANILYDFFGKNYEGYSPKYILVLGCRFGHEVVELSDKFDALSVGVDVVPEFVQQACFDVPTLCQDMHTLSIPDKSFDISVCINSLEHCYDIGRAVKEMVRVTRGFVYTTAALETDRGYFKSHYSFSNDPEEWLTLLSKCGLTPITSWIEKATLDNNLHVIAKIDG